VVDGQFGDPVPAVVQLGRNVAVALPVEVDPVECFGAVGLECTPEVVDVGAGESGQSGLDVRRDRLRYRVLPVATPAADAVVPVGQFVEESRDIGGVVLSVRVHRDDEFARGLFDAGVERRALSEVARQQHADDFLVFGRQVQDGLPRPVRAAVVDDDHLDRPVDGVVVEHSQYLGDEVGDVVRLVVRREDD